MGHLPILGPPDEWFSLKEAIFYSGRSDRTLRDWVKIHGIGRQSGKNGRIEISIPGLEMIRCGDPEALELLRAGERSHPRVQHYVDQLTQLGVLPWRKGAMVRKPLPTTATALGPREMLLSAQSKRAGDGLSPPPIDASSVEEIQKMTDEGSHAKVAERIRAILRSEEGQFMPNLANVLAFDLDMSASEALKILETATKEIRLQNASSAEAKRQALQ